MSFGGEFGWRLTLVRDDPARGKKNATGVVKPWQKRQWCIPAVGAAFVVRMEDLLDLYAEPYDRRRPVVCFDELPVQLVSEVRARLPAAPGRVARQDYEYKREGVANAFVHCEPLRGWRHLAVTSQRCKADFAAQMGWLVDVGFPRARVIRVVLDNLSTHTPEALYETFPRPKHGSWLNMAEIELSILTRECLGRRIPSPELLAAELAAYERRRDRAAEPIRRQFTNEKARVKLHRLYPSNPS